MAIANFSQFVSNVALSLANYKQAGGDWGAAMTAVGFTQTADTGQTNWSTVAAVPAAPGVDYEIRQFTDALQSTAPFYVKIETYATGSSGIFGLNFRLSVGTGTNGAGVLTGNVSGFFTMAFFNFVTAGGIGNQISYMSGDGSRYQLNWMPNATGAFSCVAGFVSLERLRDATGATLPTGLQITLDSRSAGKLAQVIFSPSFGQFYPAAPSAWTAAMPNSGTASFGGNIGLFPILANLGYPNNPGLGALGVFNTDSPVGGAIISVSEYGVFRNYMMTRTDGQGLTGVNGNGATSGAYVLYQ